MTEGDNYPIPAGFYSSATGLTHAKDGVEDCPVHHYCPEGSAEPTPCPIDGDGLGTYYPGNNAEAEEDCLPCPRGEWCNYYAYYSATAVAAYNHATAEASYRGECTGGEVCSGGAIIDNTSDAKVTACTAGYYCPDFASTT
jgi:hypothetical protein